MSQHNGSNDFGAWLKVRRIELGLSDQQIAKLLRLSVPSYRRLENGSVPRGGIPSDDQKRIYEVLGSYLRHAEQEAYPLHVRMPESTAQRDKLPKHMREIAEILSRVLDKQNADVPLLGYGDADGLCDKCGALVSSDNDRCPEGHPVDFSH